MDPSKMTKEEFAIAFHKFLKPNTVESSLNNSMLLFLNKLKEKEVKEKVKLPAEVE